MEVSYKKLWKILIDKDMKKKDLQAAAGISWASVTKLSKGETVSLDVTVTSKIYTPARVELRYRRPWEKDVEPWKTLQLTIRDPRGR